MYMSFSHQRKNRGTHMAVGVKHLARTATEEGRALAEIVSAKSQADILRGLAICWDAGFEPPARLVAAAERREKLLQS